MKDFLYGLYGAWRLALGDRQGLFAFDPSPRGAWLSFRALWGSVPLWFFMDYVWRGPGFEELKLPVFPAALLSTLGQFIAHMAVLFVVLRICLETKRLHRFPLYVSLQNWASLFVALLLVIGGSIFGALDLDSIVQVPILIAQVLYSYFLTRVGLNMAHWPAIGVCLIEIFITFIVNASTFMLAALPYLQKAAAQ